MPLSCWRRLRAVAWSRRELFERFCVMADRVIELEHLVEDLTWELACERDHRTHQLKAGSQ